MFDDGLNLIPPQTQYRCVYCGETKPGAFHRPFSGPGNGWDRGRHHGVWMCHDCYIGKANTVRLSLARGLLQEMYDDLNGVSSANYIEWLRRAREWLDGV